MAIVGVLGSAHPSVAAPSTAWTRPVPVSDIQKTPSSWFPDLAVGSDGSVHIIWSSGLPGAKKEDPTKDLLMYRELRNGTWSPVNDIDNTGQGGYTVRNSIIMGQDGRLHILVRQGLVTTYLSAPWDSAWSARSWSKPRAINGGSSYFNALAMDNQGALHILWNEAISDDPKGPKPICSFCADLFYRHSSDGGKSWSAPINLSQSLEGSVKQQIKVDRQNYLHVVWEEGFDWYASQGQPTAGVYRRSRDGGQSWDAPVRFTLPALIPQQPISTPTSDATPVPTPAPIPDAPRQMTIGLYQNRAPLVVYRGNVTDKLYYQFSEDQGETWSKTAAIPGIYARGINDTDHDDYSLATDGTGHVHLIGTGFLESDINPATARLDPDSSLKLLHVVWNGKTWSTPEVIASDETYPDVERVTLIDGKRPPLYPEWPRAVISGDTLHVTWFTRNKQELFTSDQAHYQVWYTSTQIDGPAIAPVALFTPVPNPTASAPVATSAPIPTQALAAAAASAPPIDQRSAWEGPGILTVGIAIFFVLLLLALTIGMRTLVIHLRHRAQR